MISPVRIWATLSACAALLGCGGADPPERPHVVLLTVESLRPDHIGSYSGERNTSPHLDALAEESLVFDDAHAVTSWTLASHASMFTGLYPSAHGADGPRSKLDDRAQTLAELLAASGYQTAGFASGPYLTKRHNLHQGFEHYDDSSATQGTQGGAHDDVTNPALERTIQQFLRDERDESRPLFLFAYYWDPHYDYIPPPPFASMFVQERDQKIDVRGYESDYVIGPHISDAELAYVLSQYDGEIRYTDHFLGRLFEALDAAGLWRDSLVIITSDHGEEFFDHGQKGHKRTLYAESVHVPLYVKLPRSARVGRDERLTSLVDLFATVLDAAGVDVPRNQGRSLFEAEDDPDRSIFFELLSTFYHRKSDGSGYRRETEEWLAVRSPNHKLIQVPSEDRVELYVTGSDPKEQLNVAIERPEVVSELTATLEAFRAESQGLRRTTPNAEANLDPSEVEQLRALGYLDRPADPSSEEQAPSPTE